MVEQALKGGWRAIEGHRKLLAHYGHGQIGGCHPPQDIGYQVAALEAAGVHVVPGSAQAARFAALAPDATLAARRREARG